MLKIWKNLLLIMRVLYTVGNREIALEKGWQPEQKGGTFELSLNSEEHNF